MPARCVAVFLLGLSLSGSVFAADNSQPASDDPLLDARIEVAQFQYWYTDRSPKMIAAKQRVEILSKTSTETPAAYQAHIQERVDKAETEDRRLSYWFTEKAPKRMAIKAELNLLQQELQPTKTPSPSP